jgi:hypothetical protein
MDNEMETVESTEVTVEKAAPERMSIRDALQQHIADSDDTDETQEEVESNNEPEAEQEQVQQQVEQQVQAAEKPALLPPADMRKEEKDAFLNPTPENAHILQGYLNRRAYETRADYSRKMAEVEDLRKNTASVYDTLKQYENDYAKQGISIGDIAKRSIAWDQSMRNNPVETALDWLQSYGLTPADLYQQAQDGQQEPQPQYQQQNYLTREEAERIADERLKAAMQQQEQKAVEYYNQRVVQSFMNSKPVFRDPETASQIEADMAPVVQALTGTGRYSSPEEILETAYNYVINGNPAYSSLVSKMTAKPAIQEQKAAVQKAKAASRSISGSAGSGTPRIETKDLRDNLRRRLLGGE